MIYNVKVIKTDDIKSKKGNYYKYYVVSTNLDYCGQYFTDVEGLHTAKYAFVDKYGRILDLFHNVDSSGKEVNINGGDMGAGI